MSKRHLRICSNSLVIRDMQIKTTLRYHLTPVRIPRINNTEDNLSWRGCGVRGTLIHCWWGCKYVPPLWKSVWQFLKKLGVTQQQEPLCNSWVCPVILKKHLLNYDHCSTICNSHSLESIQVSLKRRMVSECVDHIHIRVLPSGKKQ